MTTRNILIGLAVVLILAFGVYWYQSRYGTDAVGGNNPATVTVTIPPPGAPTSTPATGTPRAMTVEDYVRGNISLFAPVKEQVGGKFFVTEFTAANGKGRVSYEDGHSAYTADFTYSTDDRGAIIINTFVLRK